MLTALVETKTKGDKEDSVKSTRGKNQDSGPHNSVKRRLTPPIPDKLLKTEERD